MSTYSSNVAYVAYKLLKLEALKNIKIMGAFSVHIIEHYMHNWYANPLYFATVLRYSYLLVKI